MLGIKFFVQRFLTKRYLSGLPGVVCDLDGSVFATRTDGLHLEFKELAQNLESNVCFVSLCGNYFVKVNNITGLRKIFRYAFSNPKRFSLVHEFANLLRLSSTDLSPQPKAFMVKVGLFGIREILLTEYFKGSLTLQEYLAESLIDRRQATVFDLVCNLFLQSWHKGFTHLDPHLNNIVVFPSAQKVYFVDFEGCKFSESNKELHFGFLFGRFYSFWFRDYISEQGYDNQVLSCLDRVEPSLEFTVFLKWYAFFKSGTVSRRDSEKVFGMLSKSKIGS